MFLSMIFYIYQKYELHSVLLNIFFFCKNFTKSLNLISREAAEDAGFNVLRVISQPSAAALAYGNIHLLFAVDCDME